jgi:predicted anti-sigma-YlaC factor YlaD
MSLAALSGEDAERRAAEAHIATCDACRALWRESAELLVMLDSAARPEPISDALLQRVQAAVSSAQPEPQPWYERLLPWGFVIGALASLGLFWVQLGASVPAELQGKVHGVGWGCLRFELGLAAVAFGFGVVWAHRLARELGPLHASLAAMSGALVGQWLLESRCEADQTALHLLLFHVAGVALAAALGAAAGGVSARLGKARA